jgi:hypothetical protein
MAIEITDVSTAPPQQPEDDQLSLYRRHGKWLAASPSPAESGPLPTSNKAEVLGLRHGSPEINPRVRVIADEQRSSAALRLFILVVVLMLAGFATFGGMLFSFYQKEVLPRLGPTSSGKGAQELVEEKTTAHLRAALDVASTNLEKASTQILRLQKQVDELRSGQSAADQQLKGLSDKLQQAASDPATKQGPPTDVAAAIQIASVIPTQSAVGKELWLLKERNRLTLYADQAIAEGSSEAMANLWTSLRDPELEPIRQGVQAEIMRVQKAYVDESRLPADYRLPVRELFKGTSLRSEAELRPEELITLLKDPKQPVFVRARAAYVLGGHPVPSVGKALIDAMKNDPSLDVAREAHQTLQRFFGMSAPLFHVAAAEAWWQSQTKK